MFTSLLKIESIDRILIQCFFQKYCHTASEIISSSLFPNIHTFRKKEKRKKRLMVGIRGPKFEC